MHTPLYFAKIMDSNSQPYNNKWDQGNQTDTFKWIRNSFTEETKEIFR